MIFCIDSHVFIWAIKKQASEHDIHRLKEAEEFLKWIDEAEHILMVPTVVLAECLSQEPLEKQSAIMKIAHETCVVLNFDVIAALKYAQVLNLEKFQIAKAKAKTEGVAREQMKIDYLIVCCALANGVQRIYSHDPDIYKFAEGLIDVQPLPVIKRVLQQQLLFETENVAQIASKSIIVQEKGLEVIVEKVNDVNSKNETKDSPVNHAENEQTKSTEENNSEIPPGELRTEAGD